jgi:hypothetical protein
MVTITSKSKHPNGVENYLVELNRRVKQIDQILNTYGVKGCDALTSMTPMDTGQTAFSWSYQIIKRGNNSYVLQFNNSHVEKGVNIAIILQTGHPTRNGGWVEGRDYLTPALQPIFDEIANKAWGEIKRI